ncbi:glycosyltransferase [Rubellicoccus peritrichatus]|uniref:Glycosyltransferase n=1 Tax=Rubellicoccus peritrichatus TaxID=3080537 RepID=A0AAQ3QU46_9BACT|nr:glycosyltransferase [Puniceicoccus sp. CR14]WOO42031.1 glycosyltransferase [Puniceicoccus sp. CR14]
MRYAFYDDSLIYGGHEVMTLKAIEYLSYAFSEPLIFYFNPSNKKLGDALHTLNDEGVIAREIPDRYRKLQGIRNRFEKRLQQDLASRFEQDGVQALVAVQGDIELSSRCLIAGRSAGIPVVSYIPMPHTLKDMGARLGRFRDLFNDYLFELPNGFITISKELAAGLRQRGARCPIEVVYNGVEIIDKDISAHDAREQFGLPQTRRCIALVGRLETVQKGQLLLLEAYAESSFLRENAHVVFAGSGPDEMKIKDEAERLGIQDQTTLTGWCDPQKLYPGLDCLALASRYEGMPLVMLEALGHNVPVVAPDRDGMREMLPEYWRYPPQDAGTMRLTLEKVLEDESSKPTAQRLGEHVRNEMTVSDFQVSFASALRKLFASSS